MARTSVAAAGAGALGGGQGRRHHGRARVEHRGQVGVVVVERVGEDAVDERRHRGRGRGREADGRGDRGAAGLVRPAARGAARVERGRGDGDAERVEHPHADAVDDLVGQVVDVVSAANSPSSSASGRGAGHAGLIASGRTGEPVAPYRLSGIEHERELAAQPVAERRSRSIASTM